MKLASVINVSFLCCLSIILLLGGCALGESVGQLPAEVQAAIDSGAVGNVNLGAVSRAGTGTLALEPVMYPYNYEVTAKRYTPASRIAWNLGASVYSFDTYIFYIDNLPAQVIGRTATAHIINSTIFAAFLDRGQGSESHNVTAYALNAAGYLTITGTCLYTARLSFGFSSMGAPCSAPYTGYQENAKAEYYNPLRDISIAITGGSASYWVLKDGNWYQDYYGYAGNCVNISMQGFKARVNASPKIFPAAGKIGLAYRLCTLPSHEWTKWGYIETGYGVTPSQDPEVLSPNGTIGIQIALFLC